MAEYIERETLIHKKFYVETNQGGRGWVISLEDLSKAPTADVEPVRHGRWIVEQFKEPVCSHCEKTLYAARFSSHNYCPNCGAKMDLEVRYVPIR